MILREAALLTLQTRLLHHDTAIWFKMKQPELSCVVQITARNHHETMLQREELGRVRGQPWKDQLGEDDGTVN